MQRDLIAEVVACVWLSLQIATPSYAQQSFNVVRPGLENRLTGLSNYIDKQVKVLDANELTLRNSLNTRARSNSLILHGSGQVSPDALNNILLPQHLDVVRSNKNDLSEFSKIVKSTLSEISGLPVEDVIRKLNSTPFPDKIQELLVLAPDGSRLPPPPHLDLVPALLPVNGGTLAPSTLAPYAVGPGVSATVEYPSVANVTYSWMGMGQSTLCTGTLVSRRAVLTAAHCFCNFAGSTKAPQCNSATYMRGAEELRATDPKYVRVFFQDLGSIDVKQIIINPNYDWPKKDLALLILSLDVTEIMPAPINEAAALPAGTFGTVVGFGVHSQLSNGRGTNSGVPIQSSQGLKLYTTVKTAKCVGTRASQELICWNVEKRLGDVLLGTTCHGDSGGPLFAKINGRWSLVGVTSGGLDDCTFSSGPGTQSFDVDLRKSSDWIKQTADIDATPWPFPNKTAFISDPLLRAYSAPYHLFADLPDTWKMQFFVPANLARVTISINATPTFSSLALQLDAPGTPLGATSVCRQESADSYATCKVGNPASGTWTASITGSRPQETQLVAAIYR